VRRSRLLTAAALGLGLVLALDATAYAATGSSLVLGRLNSAGTTTTLTMTGTGSALRLLTASSTAAPLSTNATGRVANLNADRVDGYDASGLVALARSGVDASRLGGRTLAEVLALAPAPRLSFVRTGVAQQPNPGAFPGILSAAGADPGTYRLAGTVTIPCTAANEAGYTLSLLAIHSSTQRTALVDAVPIAAERCGSAVGVATTASLTSASRLLVQVHDVDAGGPAEGELSVALRGEPTLRAL
jgi:hypothetical protein